MLASFFCWSQKSNPLVDKRITYTSNEGYKINDPIYVTYDKLGWLWIAGRKVQENQFKLDNDKYIIQRFDGVNFYDVAMPKFEYTVSDLWMIDYNNHGNVYVHVQYTNDKVELYKINTSSLKFTRIKAYDSFSIYRSYKHFVLNDTLFFMFGKNREVFLYKLEGDDFIYTDTGIIDDDDFHLDPYFSPYKGKYSIINFPHATSFLINDKGKIIKKIIEDDYVTKSPKKEKFFLNYSFVNRDTIFLKNSNKDIFKLDEEQLKLIEIEPLKFLKDNSKHFVFYLNKNDKYVYVEKNQSYYKVKYVDVKEKPVLVGEVEMPYFTSLTSKNLNKELLFFYQNTLEYIQLNQSNIENYFKDESIRTVKEIAENEYIVGTDVKGFFKLNTLDNSQEKIQITDRNKEFRMEFSRDIFLVENDYIFNGHFNLYKVDKNYKVLEKYPLNKLSEEIIKIGDTIFKGSLKSEGIYKFSLQNKQHSKVDGVTDFVREFATDSKKLYAVTMNQGLLEYYNGNTSYYIPKKEEPKNLLAINFDKNYGLLVTTKHGKVYRFNTKNKQFTNFYEDSLKTSIVGVVSDTAKIVWMNTYAGILAYNPVTKFEKRYTKKDGIYELEGNRYSTTIDSKGNIFMGTINGLNYFNPYELIKSNITVDSLQLQFGSLSFYDIKNNQWETKTKPSYLNSLTKITLPSYNRRFNAKVAVANVINNANFNYRYRLINNSEKRLPSWRKLKIENEIEFPSLSSGHYTLQVEILNSINKKLRKTLELSIVSQQIFYKTWWFSLAILIVIIMFFNYLFYQSKAKQKLQTANEIAMNEAKIKEAMMLEIHHRIKNNLQVVSGLLGLQAFNSSDDELKSKLQESQGRIESIAGIHNILYKGDSQEEIDVEEYFNDIISYNKTLFSQHVKYQLDIASVKLPMDKSIPLALILNELINNSHKHAFDSAKKPSIYVEFKEGESNYTFLYTDSGEFKEKEGERISMGMKIISMMITQLKGNVEFVEEGSFQLKLQFPRNENRL